MKFPAMLAACSLAFAGCVGVQYTDRVAISPLVADRSKVTTTVLAKAEEWGGGHGVFTHYLLKGLIGEADTNQDGIVTLGEAMDYTSEHVRRDTQSQQHPDTAGMFDRSLPMAIVQ